MINSGTLAIPVLPGKVLPQRVAEPVQQIRFAANGVRLPTQSLDQFDERVFLDWLQCIRQSDEGRMT